MQALTQRMSVRCFEALDESIELHMLAQTQRVIGKGFVIGEVFQASCK